MAKTSVKSWSTNSRVNHDLQRSLTQCNEITLHCNKSRSRLEFVNICDGVFKFLRSYEKRMEFFSTENNNRLIKVYDIIEILCIKRSESGRDERLRVFISIRSVDQVVGNNNADLRLRIRYRGKDKKCKIYVSDKRRSKKAKQDEATRIEKIG